MTVSTHEIAAGLCRLAAFQMFLISPDDMTPEAQAELLAMAEAFDRGDEVEPTDHMQEVLDELRATHVEMRVKVATAIARAEGGR